MKNYFIILMMLCTVVVHGQNVIVSTLAGRIPYADGTGTAARFYNPQGVAVDASGTIYLADTGNNRIRKITPGGVVSTLAGSTYGFADGTGTDAQFSRPIGIAVDGSGNLYVADQNNNRIRKITPEGVVSTLAGSTMGYAEGMGTEAKFYQPEDVAVDVSGNVYVADKYNNRIRKVTPDGVVSTIAGDYTWGYADGTGTTARFYNPQGVVVDASGTVYVADTGNLRIRKITADGAVTTLAGGTWGNADGTGGAAQFRGPKGIALDGNGNLYVADTDNDRIRKVTPSGTVTTLAGSTPGYSDGIGAEAQFNRPNGVAADAGGNVYVTDNSRIRKIIPGGVVSTLAGSGISSADGTGAEAQFNNPDKVAVDSNGNVYVTDNNLIRKITPDGVVSTLAGSTLGYADGTGAAAQFSSPIGIAVDGSGNAYVADWGNHRIRKITPGGEVSTLAGSTYGYVDGTVATAKFGGPMGVAVDGTGNVYVADTDNLRIRKIAPSGAVSTLAGSGIWGYADGTGAEVQFRGPRGIALDGSGNLYVADANNNCIRKITPEGVVSTLAGGTEGYADGKGAEAKFFLPQDVAVDKWGNAYLVDTYNHRIRKITPRGGVSTLAGSTSGYADGTGTEAQFSWPRGIVVDVSGNVYVADNGNNLIRKIEQILPPCPEILTLSSTADDYSAGSILKQASAADGSIKATNKITGTADVTYEARLTELHPGFMVTAGAVFKVLVGGCE